MGCNDYKMISKKVNISEGIPLLNELKRGGHVGGVVDGSVLIAGGNKWTEDKSLKVWFKDGLVFKDDSWVEGPSLPVPLSYSMYANYKNSLYIAGGTSDGITMSRDVYYIKSINKGAEWISLPQLPEGIAFGAGAIVKDNFYIIGGTNGVEKLNTVWMLDLRKSEMGWVQRSSMPGSPRVMAAISIQNNDLYVIGGLGDGKELNPLNDVFRYDTEQDQWYQQGVLPLKGYAWVAQFIGHNRMLITGRADGTIHNGVWIIDLDNMSMTRIASLCAPSTTAPLVKVSKDTWWLIGGEPDANKNRTEKVSIIKFR